MKLFRCGADRCHARFEQTCSKVQAVERPSPRETSCIGVSQLSPFMLQQQTFDGRVCMSVLVGDPERQRDGNKLPRSTPAFGVVWMVDDFPQMSIWVAKVTGVDAPGSVVQFSDECSSRLSFG
jgi:hypothetical protein